MTAISDALNERVLPSTLYAVLEQVAGLGTPDVLALSRFGDLRDDEFDDADTSGPHEDQGGLATATAPPRVAKVQHVDEAMILVQKKNRVVVRHTTGDDIVAMIELVSPGNKSDRAALKRMVEKFEQAIQAGVHALMIDPFEPGSLDELGVHSEIWTRCGGESLPPLADRPLTLASYHAVVSGDPDTPVAYVEPTAVGRELIDMPLFFAPGRYVNVPLEETYNTAFGFVPKRWRDVITGG